MSGRSQTITMDISGREVTCMRQIFEREPKSLLAEMVKQTGSEKIFLDRDPSIMSLIINALRHPQLKIIAPDNFDNWNKLKEEAMYWKLDNITENIIKQNPQMNTITVAYHGTLMFGKQGLSCDVNFRKIMRILICGKTNICREVFGDTLNETRYGGGMMEENYTSRFYLKHTFLEQAFDCLMYNGFKFVSASTMTPQGMPDARYHDDHRFMHYNQFVFQRRR
uniref:BTB_2 domain-containing protein n=1 Tax=Strongyloides venezuelensis TaxID=75913 RepID=A0A0K0G3U6_STRVS